MAGAEDKAKAERLAAARKRVEQLKKQKAAKKAGASTTLAPAEDGPPPRTEAEDVLDALPLSPGVVDQQGAEEEEEEEEEEEGEKEEKEDKKSKEAPATPSHARQPSLSLQSRLRSTSFRASSLTHAPPVPTSKSPSTILPPLSPSADIPDIYRKQAARIEELERENRRLDAAARDAESRCRKALDEVQELCEERTERELHGGKGQQQQQQEEKGEGEVVSRLTAEIASLRRQITHLQSQRASKSPTTTASDPSDLQAALESKEASIEDMAYELSSLRASLASQSAAASAQVTTLQSSLASTTAELHSLRTELSSCHTNLEQSTTQLRKVESQLAATQREAAETKPLVQTLKARLAARDTEARRLREDRERWRLRTVDTAGGEGEAAEEEAEEDGVRHEKNASLEFDDIDLAPEPPRTAAVLGGLGGIGGVWKGVLAGVAGVASSKDDDLQKKHDSNNDDDDEDFDASAYAAAQAADALMRVERVREVKRSLPSWASFRLDLVAQRSGVFYDTGAVVLGEVFEV
ncbi:MAG: hypothetical protein M1829_006192 [Trizodia sp. TS-e1964]|nr:MAG: hypothetical protein M1829_006192 [Trizodia sp. TS-e1964]